MTPSAQFLSVLTEKHTVAPLDKIDPPFAYVVVLTKLKQTNGAVALHAAASSKDAWATWRRNDWLADWLTG